jgi:lipopolysaccharide exporter
LIKVIFGQKWILAILPMQLLCIMGGFRTIGLAVPSLILSKGRPDINLKLNLAKLALLVPCLLIAVRFGAVGVALGLSVVAVVFWPIQQIFANRLIGLKMREYLMALFPAAFGSAVMAMVLLALRYAATSLLALPDIGMLLSSAVLGIVVYFVTLKAIRIKAFNEMIGLVLEMVSSYLRPVMVKLGLVREGALPAADEK